MTTMRRYADIRSWFRNLLKSCVNAGTSALLAGAGLNTLEQVPVAATQNIGLDLRQMAGVFVAAALWEALRRINAATAETNPPFPPTVS